MSPQTQRLLSRAFSPVICRAAARLFLGASAAAAASLAASVGVATAQPADPLAPPPNRPGLADEVRVIALVGANVQISPDRLIERGVVVMRGDRITAVLDTDAAAPLGAEAIDLRGKWIYPGLIDASVEVDAPRPDAESAGVHWSLRVMPQRSALDGDGLSKGQRESLRKQGIVAAHIVPKGGVFRGQTAVVSTAAVPAEQSARRPQVYRAGLAQTVVMETGGTVGDRLRWGDYPDSQMGAIALIRQTLLDAQYRKARVEGGLEGGASALDALAKDQPLFFAVDDELETLRVGKIAREMGRKWIVRGNGTEFARLDAIAKEKDRAGLVVPVNFPETPNVASLGEAMYVNLRDLMTWEQAPTNPARLFKAGVPVAITGAGLKDISRLHERVRTAVRHGLSERDALASLTTIPAAMLGVDAQLGTIEVGKRASVIVTDKPLTARGMSVLETWVDGSREEIKPDRSSLAGLYMLTLPVDVAPKTDAKPDARPEAKTDAPVDTWALQIDDKGGVKVLRWQRAEEKPAEPRKPEEKPAADGAPAQPDAKPAAPAEKAPDAAAGNAPEKPAAPVYKLVTGEAKNEQVDQSRLSFTLEFEPFAKARPGVWSLSGLVTARDKAGMAGEIRGDGRRADGTSFVWSATRDPRSAWLGTWRVIENDGKAMPAPETGSRQVRIEIAPEQAGLSAKVLFAGFDRADAMKVDALEAENESFDGTMLSFDHHLKVFKSEARSFDRVTLEDPSGKARLRGVSAIREAGKPDEPHAYVAARDEGEPEPRVDVPSELPGKPFGPYAMKEYPKQESVALINATIWTSGPEGTFQGALLMSNGKIDRVVKGKVEVPTGFRVIDCTGKHITPGIIDCHSHTGISKGVNEAGQAVTAEVRIGDVTDPDTVSWYRQLAAGVTTVNNLHGSANAIGGQNQVNKNRWGAAHPDDLHFAGAIPGIKFALGENPKQSNWGDANNWRYPQTRMGVEAIIRDRFTQAKQYDAAKAAAKEAGKVIGADGKTKPVPFRVDLELEAVAEILRGERLVHCHSYRQDEILMLARVAQEFGFKIGTYQHILEGYKVAEAVRDFSGGGSGFADWWGYKVEVQDAIPQAGPIMHEQGVVVSFNSDSDEMARRMNVEAAKAHKYAILKDGTFSVSKDEALQFVTLNPAKQLRIDKQTGSLQEGKDADVVVWNGEPLSTASFVERTFVDGRELWSRQKDAELRAANDRERLRLVQKILSDRKSKPPAKDAAPEAPKPETPKPPSGVRGGLIARMNTDAERLLEAMRLDRVRRGKDAESAVAGECGCHAP